MYLSQLLHLLLLLVVHFRNLRKTVESFRWEMLDYAVYRHATKSYFQIVVIYLSSAMNIQYTRNVYPPFLVLLSVDYSFGIDISHIHSFPFSFSVTPFCFAFLIALSCYECIHWKWDRSFECQSTVARPKEHQSLTDVPFALNNKILFLELCIRQLP